MKSFLTVLIVCLLPLVDAQANTGSLPSQEIIEVAHDFGDGAGQTFSLPFRETIYGIELYIQSGNGTVELDLWETINENGSLIRNGNQPAASGTLAKETLAGETPGWFAVEFDSSYTNLNGPEQDLVFEIRHVGDGYNNYGASNSDLFAGGSYVYWYSGEYEEDDFDFAFRLLDSPPDSGIVFEYSDYDDGVALISYQGDEANITIPESIDGKPVRVLFDTLFIGKESIESISIPSTVVSVEVSTFRYLDVLESITVDSDNDYFSAEDGVLFNEDKTKLIRCPNLKLGEYTVPDSVVTLEKYAFYFCRQLTEIHLPEGITSLPEFVFYACTSLSSFTIPGTVTSIDSFAFSNCSALESLTIPETVTSLGPGAFYGIGLESIVIPSSITRLSSRLFQYSSLKTIIIPNSVTVISSYVFGNCPNLERLVIPSRVTEIGAFTFNNTDIRNLIFEGNAPDLINVVFLNNPSDLVAFYHESATGFDDSDWDDIATEPYTGPTPNSEYSAWLARQSYRTDLDPMTETAIGDPIILAYALDFDPRNPAPSQIDKPSLNGQQLEYRFYGARDDITYTVMTSPDLKTWNTTSASISEPDSMGYRTATVSLPSDVPVFVQVDVQSN